MNRTTSLTRRTFIERAATVTAIGFAAPPLAWADDSKSAGKRPGPNSRIHLGIIGCGGMGTSNLRNCGGQPDVVVTAACDVWRERRERVVQHFKDTCKSYSDFREMLEQPGLDAVIIATPPHWHALVALEACRARKDIYVQKPMTLHLGESLALRNAVKRHGVISQVGTQIHATENYRRVVEYIRSGNLGAIGTVRTFDMMNQTPNGIGHSKDNTIPDGLNWDFWCGPAPKRPFNRLCVENAYNNCSWMDYSGGWTPGMAPHIIDLPIWACDLGYPSEVSCSGGRFILNDDGDAYDNHEVLWRYPSLTMTWMTSLTNSFGFAFEGDPAPRRRLGVYFHGGNGTLQADYNSLKLVPEGDRLKGVPPPPKSIPPSPGQEREWLDSIKSRRPPLCNVFYHSKVDVPIVLSLLSLKLGRSIRFDPATQQIIGDPEAAKLSVPNYRAPWRFPQEYLAASLPPGASDRFASLREGASDRGSHI